MDMGAAGEYTERMGGCGLTRCRFQNSYGSALRACELLDQALAPRAKL